MADNPGIYTKDCVNDGASPYGFSPLVYWDFQFQDDGIAIDATNHRLFVSDFDNGRVLVFPLTSGNLLSSKTPSYVLGQSNFTTCDVGSTPSATNINAPGGLAYDATNNRLFVMDSGFSRVLEYDFAGGISNGMAASYVLGESTLTIAANGTTAQTLMVGEFEQGADIAYDSARTYLYVADGGNSRVLAFNVPYSAHYTSGESATYVLGQSGFTTSTTATTATGLNDPMGVAIDTTNSKLYVSDGGNDRVLVYSTPVSTHEAATYALGQTSLTTAASCGPTQSTVGLDDGTCSGVVGGLAVDPTNSRLFVADWGNNRVLVFPTPLSSNGESATYVLGQANFSAGGYFDETGGGPSSLGQPTNVAYDSTNNQLYVMDASNNRVMLFNTGPTAPTPTLIAQTGADGCIIASSKLYCTGWNAEGEDGDGSNVQNYIFQQVGSLTNWTAVSAGYLDYLDDRDACGIAGGALYCWGESSYGEAGSACGSDCQSPTQVGSLTTWTAVSTSGRDTCGLNNGYLYCWGNNEYGEDGVGNTTQQTTPQLVTYTTGLVGWWKLTDGSGTSAADATGNGHTGTLENSPTWATSGINGGGLTLAYASTQYVDVPDVAALRLASSWTISTWVNLTSLPGSAAEFILLDKDSTGGYTNYQLAYDNDTGNDGASAGWVVSYNVSGSTTNHYEKYVVTPSTGTWYLITGVYSSTAHTLTLYVNGVQEATGSVSGFTPDSAGGVDLGLGDEIGVGNNSNITIDDARVYNTALTAAQVAELYTWSTVSTGGYDTCAITTGGALYCWGYNTDGEDGNGGTTQSSIPVQVGSLTSWSTVSQGGYDTCGINAGGKLYCWGINEYGENGTNNTTQNKSPTEEHLSLTNWTAVSTDGSGGGLPDTCGLAGGKLYCWGYNNEGEDGVGNATEHNSPVQVGSLTTWTAVGYGNQDACAVNSSGLYCWGENAYGEDGLGNITAYNTPQPVTLGGITGEGATDEIGQYTSMTSTATDAWYNYGPNNGMNELGFEYPQGIALDPVNHYLYVSDCDNNRVMVYALSGDNSISASSPGHTASYVLGQTGLQAPNNPNTDSNPTQTNIGCPDGLAVDTVHSRLFVADTGGDRVLVFTTPVSSGQSASYVLGEPDFTSYDGSQTASQTQLFYPTDVAYDSTNNLLYVVDNGNIRVVVFNVAGLASNGISASYELGQATWTTQAVATTQTGMGAYLSGPGSNYAPEGLALDSVNNRLFVSDTANNRVLVFNVPLSANDISASYVLGQSSFTTGASATTQAGFQYPTGISYDSNNNRLFVADNWNQRVLAFNVAPGTIANGESAAFEVGQTAGGTQWTSNNTGLSQSGLNLDDGCNNGPCEFSGVKYDPGSGRLFVTDSVNNRIMIFGADFMPSWTSEPP